MSAIDFVAGCFGGAAGVLIGHPLDTVKVKLQTQGLCGKEGAIYRGMMDCLMQTYKKEQLKGLYRGLSSPLASLAFINAIVFGVYGNAIKFLGNEHSLKDQFLAGSMESSLKTRSKGTRSSGKASAASFRSLLSEGTLFRGWWATVLRDAPAFGVYFASYQYTLDALEGKTPSVMLNHLLAGGIAGSASWVVVYPVDVIKTRIQVFPERYTSIMQCFRLSLEQEGLPALTRGLTPAVVRAFPVNAVTFSVVSYTLLTWEKMFQYK